MVIEDIGQQKLMKKRIYVALHILKERIKLILPKDKTFADLASDIKLYSPPGNGKCHDARGSLEFTLFIDAERYIRDFINATKMGRIEIVNAYLYETCPLIGGVKHQYASPPIDVNPTPLEDRSRQCFQGIVSFQPSYMQIEDIKLPAKSTLTLNETFAGHDDGYWWKSSNNEMLPSTISFDDNKNIIIDILNSTVITPYFFRIGIGQPISSFKFNFGTNCNDAVFEIYLNLKPDCQTFLELNQNGFTFSTSLNPNKDIQGLISSMIIGGNKIYFKVASPLSINEFETCEISNPSDVSSDQFVLQIAPFENIGDCEKAELILTNSDTVNGIEVLIDRTKIVENSTEAIDTSTVSSSTANEAATRIEWWWFMLIGLLVF
uniref:Uncharacterized protein n=1 Tax=Panagrolaimus sp. ES5 TaxID=591445 RepID=A0AC34G2X3_9BILA